MPEENKKRLFTLFLLCVSLAITLVSKKMGYFNIAGIGILFGFAVILASIVESIRDKKKAKKQNEN
ncbi:hypothetical protein FKQ51_30995 [Bacillus toyonensis]|nr:hypothetical protein [Bacillus toyonensis]OTW83921.1 hypothetical protein BK702_22855 [Bacillus thuringiensis serovar cameroun]